MTPSVVCLGVFDGVHLGHQLLIQSALDIAKEKGLKVIVHTYDKLPGSVIWPDRQVIELTPLEEKVRLLQAMGVEEVAVSTFDDALQHMSGEDFFNQVLIGQLHARHLVAGFNHRFGYRGDTDIAGLETLCQKNGIGLTVIGAVKTAEGNLVSSSAIRAALALGDEELAGEMLGREVDPDMLRRAAPHLITDAARHTTEV